MNSSLHNLIPFLPFLLNHLRLPSQETPSILILSVFDPRYIASGLIQQKTQFPINSSIFIEACLPRRCIETEVLVLLCECSFPQEAVYLVVA
jgi:hypothetical protein